MKKKDEEKDSSLYINIYVIITVILVISFIYLLFDYCSFNLGIESQSSNMCQYIILNKTFGSIYDFLYYILTFKNIALSIIVYTLILGVLLYYLYTINMLETFKEFILNEFYNYSTDNINCSCLYSSFFLQVFKCLVKLPVVEYILLQ